MLRGATIYQCTQATQAILDRLEPALQQAVLDLHDQQVGTEG